MQDEDYMRLAIDVAKSGVQEGQSPFGSCIVKGNRVVCCAHNHVWVDMDSTAHSEIIALREACRGLKTIDLSDCVLYATCEPCPMCFAACHWAKVTKIVYGASIEDARALGFSELTLSNHTMKELGHSPIKILGGYLREEVMGLFQAWRQQGKQRVY